MANSFMQNFSFRLSRIDVISSMSMTICSLLVSGIETIQFTLK